MLRILFGASLLLACCERPDPQAAKRKLGQLDCYEQAAAASKAEVEEACGDQRACPELDSILKRLELRLAQCD
jgi:hypothetical protein